MRITKCFIISSLVISTSAFAQTLPDAIKKTTNEQFEKADADFNKLLQAQPNNGEVYFYYGENFFKAGKYDMAQANYQKGAEVNATSPFPYVGLGKIQWYQNKTAEAKANFYKATTLAAGKNATVLMKIAEAYIKADTKDFAEANKLLDQAQKLEPKNPDVLLLKGDAVLEQSNNGSKAIAFYEEAAKLNPKSADAALRIGQLWNRAKNYNAAIDSYKRANSIDSSYAPAYREMAEIYALAGQFDKAVPKYKRFLEINNDCHARSRYAGFLLEAKHYEESIEAAKEALKCDTTNLYTYRYMAYAYYEANTDFEAGLASSNKFFSKVKPETKLITEDYEYHAKLLSKTGNDSLAILDYLKAMELDPEKDFYGDIASAYMKMKKYSEAVAAYDKKIAAGKGGINDYFGLSRAYYVSKDFVKADSAAAQMVRLQPELPYGYLWRAKANVQQDPKNEKWSAKPFYEEFISKVKPTETAKFKRDLVEAYTYLAAFYAKNKDCENTTLNFKKVLEVDPENAQAKNFMAKPC